MTAEMQCGAGAGLEGGRSASRKRLSTALFLAALWVWAIAGCLDEWSENPMYSYGWFVVPLVAFFAWRRLDEPFVGREPMGASALPWVPWLIGACVTVLALMSAPVELLRNEMPDDRLNNWFLSTCAIVATLWVLKCIGGWRLAVTMAFPLAFFLTGVAWPKRYESPVTVGLQKFVAGVIVEVLHVMGIHADPHGTTIYLKSGPVGIAEACSGVRSLQASLMISLAVGELFFLRWPRRVLLVGACAATAMVLNLGRTLSLCLITEYKGAEAMEKAHDWIGNAILLILPLMAWVMGRVLTMGNGAIPASLMPRKSGADGTPPPVPYLDRILAAWRALDWARMPHFGPAVCLMLLGVGAYHARIAYVNRIDPPQMAPYFQSQTNTVAGLAGEAVRKDIWEALSPTSGENLVLRNPSPPANSVRFYHFFWKPSAANRWVTGHRPDVCMPAGGWEPAGAPERVEVTIDGRKVPFFAFRFKGVGARALQLWGFWRNGELLELDFYGSTWKGWSFWKGRKHTAVEVVSGIAIDANGEVTVEDLAQMLVKAFRYSPAGQVGAATSTAGKEPDGRAPSR